MEKILVVGGEFLNKGAELMIHSTQRQLKETFPEADLFLASTLTSIEKIKASGYHPLNFPLFHVGFKSPKAFSFSLRHPFLMKQYCKLRGWAEFEGDVTLKDIDIVFDISGYAFAKKWGMTPLVNLNTLMNYVTSNGGRYVFLPQAFGPFTEEQIPVMKECVGLATLVLARDNVSAENIKDVSDNDQKVLQYSDITLSLKTDRAIDDSIDLEYCCIVPNVRMTDRAGEQWQKQYLDIMEQAIGYILEKSNLQVKVVNHSRTDDRQLVIKLGEGYSSDNRVSTVFEENPLTLKKIMGGARFNLASRFHAVASSLSGNTPCIMTSWAHKYQELAQDFQVENYCLREPDSNQLQNLLDDMLDIPTNDALREQITKINEENKKRNKEMWATIKKYVV